MQVQVVCIMEKILFTYNDLQKKTIEIRLKGIKST